MARSTLIKQRRDPKHRRRHAQAHFPALDPDEAMLVVEILERVIKSVWRAHGDAMADFLGRVAPDSEWMEQPYDSEWAGKDCPPEGDDYDF